jgi:hypothetical protein
MNYIFSDSIPNPDIESVIMLFENKIYMLKENILVLYKQEKSYYIYHLFKYTKNEILLEDRWNHLNFPLEPIENMIMRGSNTLTIIIENFKKNSETNEELNATFKIFFTDKGISKIM